MGQFERTLIIVDEGAYVHYVEGCTAPDLQHRLACTRPWSRSSSSGARDAATPPSRTGRNNVYNLVTKRAVAYEDATDGVGRRQPGQQADHEVPGRLPDGARARAARSSPSPSPADGQHQDAGGKVVHVRPAHLQPDHLQVHQQGRRAGPATAAW